MRNSHQFGVDCEVAAAVFYQLRGGEILDRNYRCRAGELDLIVKEGSFLVFVEVRGRVRSPEDAVFSVDRRKRAKLIRAARWFLACEGGYLPPGIAEIRFDLVTVDGAGAVTRIPNAFFL